MKRLFFLAVFIVFCFAAEASQLTAAAENEPARGQPFILDLRIPGDVGYFNIRWQGLNIDVPAAFEAGEEAVAYAKLMLPAKYDEAGIFPLGATAFLADGTSVDVAIDVRVGDKIYPRQNLKVDPKYVTPPAEEHERIARERSVSAEALGVFSEKRMWTLPLRLPRPADYSGVYGAQRFFNGEARNKHGGLDFRGGAGDDIRCVADGKIILTGNFYYNGNFVMVDHGQGVITAYLHMSKIIARKGDDVKAGDLLGLVGATGRVTGPHLHMSLYVQGVAVDPQGLF